MIHLSVCILIVGWYSVAVDSLSLSVVAPILCVCVCVCVCACVCVCVGGGGGRGSVVSGPSFVIGL